MQADIHLLPQKLFICSSQFHFDQSSLNMVKLPQR